MINVRIDPNYYKTHAEIMTPAISQKISNEIVKVEFPIKETGKFNDSTIVTTPLISGKIISAAKPGVVTPIVPIVPIKDVPLVDVPVVQPVSSTVSSPINFVLIGGIIFAAYFLIK